MLEVLKKNTELNFGALKEEKLLTKKTNVGSCEGFEENTSFSWARICQVSGEFSLRYQNFLLFSLECFVFKILKKLKEEFF